VLTVEYDMIAHTAKVVKPNSGPQGSGRSGVVVRKTVSSNRGKTLRVR